MSTTIATRDGTDGPVDNFGISAPMGLATSGEHGPGEAGLFDGDTGDAPADARTVITYLVRNRILLGRDEPELWAALMDHEQTVIRHFHNMFVDLVVSRPSRVAYKQQIQPPGVRYSVIVRAVTLSLEASVLALYARERAGLAVPGETVVINRSDARAQMEPYWPAQVSNKAAKEKKLNAALDALTTQDLLIRTGEDAWEVSPAVSLVLTAQAIARFTDLLTSPGEPAATASLEVVSAGDEPEDEPDDDAGGDDSTGDGLGFDDECR